MPVAATFEPMFDKTSLSRATLHAPQGGTLMVDGVLASDQSEWILDDLVPTSWLRHLPALYGTILSPGLLAFRLLGSDGVQGLDAALGITWLGHYYGRQVLVALPAMVLGCKVVRGGLGASNLPRRAGHSRP